MKYMKKLYFGLLQCCLLAAGFTACLGQTKDLERRVLHPDPHVRGDAIEIVSRMSSGAIDGDLRAALNVALEREATIHRDRYWAAKRGERLDDLSEPELIGALARIIAELEDTGSIPALVAALGTGFVSIRGLVRFREAAVPAVVHAVRSPESTHYAVDDGLITLRMVLEQHGASISPRKRASIREIALERLRAPGYFTTLWTAIDLAAVLNDPELNIELRRIADDPQAVRDRGILDTELIVETRHRAAARLAGVPPMPRR